MKTLQYRNIVENINRTIRLVVCTQGFQVCILMIMQFFSAKLSKIHHRPVLHIQQIETNYNGDAFKIGIQLVINNSHTANLK